MKIKELYKRMIEAEQKSDEAEAAWNEDLENEELEAEFDKTYQEYFDATEELVKEIMNLIGVDKATARAIIHSKRKEFEALIKRIA